MTTRKENHSDGAFDLLMCVGPDDIEYLFPVALRLACTNLEVTGAIHLVSPEPAQVAAAIEGLDLNGKRPLIHSDVAVLSRNQAALPGWLRQQVIKLEADKICRTDHVWSLGADALVVRSVGKQNFMADGEPIIFFNRYKFPNPHLDYERKRVLAVAKLLGVEPRISYLLGDFVHDLALLDRERLEQLRRWISRANGGKPLDALLPARVRTLDEKSAFGEWTLYAVFLLDALQIPARVRNSASRLVSQIHSRHDLLDDSAYEAAVIHIVPKRLPLPAVMRELGRRGLV